MAHGYLERGFGIHGEIDPDRGDRFEFDGQDRRDRNRERAIIGHDERGWRGRGESPDRHSRDWPGQEGRRESRDDHYRSWRDRHISELDKDYRDYCREREAQFHRDFDEWRRRKYANPQPLGTGMTQSGLSHDPTGMTQAAEDSSADTPREPDPTATATLGTSSNRSRSRG